MAEPTAITVIVEPLVLLSSFLYSAVTSVHYKWWILRVASVVAFPFRLLLIPLRVVASILSVIFGPFTYLAYSIAALVSTLWAWLVSLEVRTTIKIRTWATNSSKSRYILSSVYSSDTCCILSS